MLNKKQLIVIWVMVGLITLAILFPPVENFRLGDDQLPLYPGVHFEGWRFIHYKWIMGWRWSPCDDSGVKYSLEGQPCPYYIQRIHYTVLDFEILIVFILGVFLIYILKDKKEFILTS